MESSIKIGTRRLSRDLVAFIAPAQPDPSRTEPFHAWVTLTNGNSFGAVETPEQIAKANGFAYLADDQVAINRGADIRVRTYVAPRNAAEVRAPSGEPFRTEISVSKDRDRRWQNLSTDPEAVARIVFSDADMITVHRDYVPKAQVVFYDNYTPRPDDAMQDAQGSARLLSGRNIRSPMTPQEFAFEHGFNHLRTDFGDDIAFNPRLNFTLEAVDPDDIKSQTGTKEEFQTRLTWEGPVRQQTGSKLLKTPDDEAAPVVFAGEPQAARRVPKTANSPRAARDLTADD